MKHHHKPHRCAYCDEHFDHRPVMQRYCSDDCFTLAMDEIASQCAEHDLDLTFDVALVGIVQGVDI